MYTLWTYSLIEAFENPRKVERNRQHSFHHHSEIGNHNMAFQTVLEEVLPEKFLLRGSERYEESNGAYFTVFESTIKPAAIAQPTSAAEVSALIKILYPKLVTKEVSLAIKGTGHTPFSGKPSIFL